MRKKKFSVGDMEQITIGTSRLNRKIDTSAILGERAIGSGVMNKPVMKPFQRNHMVLKVETMKKSKL